MKKIIICFAVVAVVAGCRKNLTDVNIDPKNPKDVPSYSLFTTAERVLTNTVTSSNVNLNIFRLVVQHWQETTYTDESNYDIITRPIPDQIWSTFYRDVLRDFQSSKERIPIDISDAAMQKNELAIIDILQVYTYYYLVTTFGNIPYSEALNIGNAFPKYDDQATVFTNLLTKLDADIAALSTSGGSFGTADIVYGGNVAKWKKFANSLKLKMGMTLVDADAAKAKSTVESAIASGVFTSNADNAIFNYLSSPPNTNPIWVDLVQSGRKDFVGNSTIINSMKALNDPRIPNFFTTDAAGGYSGGDPGASSNYATFSKPNDKIVAPDFPAPLLTYGEVEFFLAEAKERGYTISLSAAEHYNNAITASIVYWGGTTAQAATYLAQPSVAYATATGAYKQKIGTQKWIALYNRGWDEWIEMRRLDYPVLTVPSSAKSAFPVRFTYPINEQNVNTANYNAASTAIGTDKVTTKLFWDKL